MLSLFFSIFSFFLDVKIRDMKRRRVGVGDATHPSLVSDAFNYTPRTHRYDTDRPTLPGYILYVCVIHHRRAKAFFYNFFLKPSFVTFTVLGYLIGKGLLCLKTC